MVITFLSAFWVGRWFREKSILFSSRRRHTRYIGDWSSDVCSSDLQKENGDWAIIGDPTEGALVVLAGKAELNQSTLNRSEERRVGKSVDLGGRRIIKKKKHP